jgi:flagellar P-ring protein FlgI
MALFIYSVDLAFLMNISLLSPKRALSSLFAESVVLKVALSLTLAFVSFSIPANAARLKDVADIEGVRGNQLWGYGIVVGLNGTGDGGGIAFTKKALANLLERTGIRIAEEEVKSKNIAAVIVTSTLPAFSKEGGKIDVTLSSAGDAKSLQGGTLLFTPLRGADGNVYAVSQGPVSVGGFSVQGGGDSAVKNHPTVGVISGGATVERSIPFDLFASHRVRIILRKADFTTARRVVDSINTFFGAPLAMAQDSAAIEIPISEQFRKDPVGLVAQLEQLLVKEDLPARIVVNERSGTVIIGSEVTIGKVALAHGNLSITIRSETQVSQPGALQGGGATAVVENTDVTVGEEIKRLREIGGDITLGDLVKALNSLGASPRDLISLFTALKEAGALQAELVIM